jgi:hypothetical protein
MREIETVWVSKHFTFDQVVRPFGWFQRLTTSTEINAIRPLLIADSPICTFFPLRQPGCLLPAFDGRGRPSTWAFFVARRTKMAPTQVSRLGCVGA